MASYKSCGDHNCTGFHSLPCILPYVMNNYLMNKPLQVCTSKVEAHQFYLDVMFESTCIDIFSDQSHNCVIIYLAMNNSSYNFLSMSNCMYVFLTKFYLLAVKNAFDVHCMYVCGVYCIRKIMCTVWNMCMYIIYLYRT